MERDTEVKNSTEAIKSHVIKLLKETQNEEMEAKELEINDISGMSNKVYKVSYKNKFLIYKILAKRRRENIIFCKYFENTIKTVESNSFGAKMFENKDGIVVEECLRGDFITEEDLSSQKIRLKIMKPLAEFTTMGHRAGDFNQKLFLKDQIDLGILGLLEQKIKDLEETNEYVTAEALEVAKDIQREFLDKENSLTWRMIEKFDNLPDDMYRLAHGDFYFMNILRDKEQETYNLIDFEYSCMNPIGWDICNIIFESRVVYDAETGLFKVDFDKMPSIDEIEEMFKAYLVYSTFCRSERLRSKFDLSYDEFISKLKKGSFDRFYDKDKLAFLVKNFYKMSYVLTSQWLIWTTFKLGFKENGWNINDYIVKKHKAWKIFSEKIRNKDLKGASLTEILKKS